MTYPMSKLDLDIMTDEHKLAQAVAKAARVEELMRNDLLNEIIDDMKADYIRRWLATTSMQDAEREKLWIAAHQAEMIRDRMRKISADGRMAQAEIAKQPIR